METQNFQEKGINSTPNKESKVGIKMAIIAVLSLILLIPMNMIKDLIIERQKTSENTICNVTEQWCSDQKIIGPTLMFTETKIQTTEQDNEEAKKTIKKETSEVKILPKKLKITGDIQNKTRKKGLYEVSLYTSSIEMAGTFELDEETKKRLDNQTVDIQFEISDLKGITDEVVINMGGKQIELKPSGKGMSTEMNRLSGKIDIEELMDKEAIPFSMKLNIKGSQSLKFAPIGETTVVNLTSNSTSPSFVGNFLPDNHEIKPEGFSSDWKISYLNRNYPQEIDNHTTNISDEIMESMFGVELLIPVQHYQKSMRCSKYAMLFIILTFAVFFFIENIQKKNIHPIQYLLVGLALTLFYSLLISLSEHIGFCPAYVVASAMTILLLTFYTAAVLGIKKTALYIGGSLTGLYIYIFVLIQMETYALLAGSLGLFCILAGLMYLSQKVNWNNLTK